jgi:cell division protease FtsH
LTQLLPSEDHHSYSKKKLVGQLAMIMGGRAAEHLVFNRFTTGASDDLKKATGIARKMVCQWGMSEELGPLTYSEERNAYLGRDMLQHKWFSNASVKMIDTEVRGLLHDSYQKAFSLLETNRQVLDYLADQLIETETIDGNLVRETLKNPPAIN